MRRIVERLVDQAELFKTDSRILTPQEHLLIGSSLPAAYLIYPRRPIGLIDKSLTFEAVSVLREAKKRIVSHSAWGLYNVGITKMAERFGMVFALPSVDLETGQVEAEFPVLVGIYDSRRRSISYSPDELKKYELTPEARIRLSFEGVKGSVERMGA